MDIMKLRAEEYANGVHDGIEYALDVLKTTRQKERAAQILVATLISSHFVDEVEQPQETIELDHLRRV